MNPALPRSRSLDTRYLSPVEPSLFVKTCLTKRTFPVLYFLILLTGMALAGGDPATCVQHLPLVAYQFLLFQVIIELCEQIFNKSRFRQFLSERPGRNTVVRS